MAREATASNKADVVHVGATFNSQVTTVQQISLSVSVTGSQFPASQPC